MQIRVFFLLSLEKYFILKILPLLANQTAISHLSKSSQLQRRTLILYSLQSTESRVKTFCANNESLEKSIDKTLLKDLLKESKASRVNIKCKKKKAEIILLT